MTAPPLPASPCVRVRLDYGGVGTQEAGSRFYLSYAGSAPTAANCTTLASDVSAAWGTHIAPEISTFWGLSEVDVLDIATTSGLSGTWTGSVPGSAGTNKVPSNVAINTEFNIARRYRGGKPRMFWPPSDAGQLGDDNHWSAAFKTSMDTAVAAFFAEIEALVIGAIGALVHVNLSYYIGFKNITNSSGRERAVPQYRPAALLDTITGYNTKQVVGSQRRRRTSTTF